MNDIFGIGGGGGDGAGIGGGRGGGNRGRDMTLRQLAISRFDELGYVDVKVFARNNLTARRPSKLNDILSSAEFIAAWASYNTELQKYLLSHHRVDDALMVTKYLGQLIRLLTDFPTQWQTVVTLDTHIRSSEYVEGPIVWTVDANDDEVSSFRTDIRLGHQLALRATPALVASAAVTRSTPSNTRRGSDSGSQNSKRKSMSVCYAYNGEVRPNEFTNINHCRGNELCRYLHLCLVCSGKHAVYENKDCAARPRSRDLAVHARPPRASRA
jgi:hypothetical protein